MIPYDVVGFAQTDSVLGCNEIFQRGHKLLHFFIQRIFACAVIAAGNQSKEFTRSRAVVSNSCR